MLVSQRAEFWIVENIEYIVMIPCTLAAQKNDAPCCPSRFDIDQKVIQTPLDVLLLFLRPTFVKDISREDIILNLIAAKTDMHQKLHLLNKLLLLDELFNSLLHVLVYILGVLLVQPYAQLPILRVFANKVLKR